MKASFTKMKRVTDPFDENAKARIFGMAGTRPDYASSGSGSEHSAQADDDDAVTSSSLSALFLGCDIGGEGEAAADGGEGEAAADGGEGADLERDRLMRETIAASVDVIGRIVEDEGDVFRNRLRVYASRAAEIFSCLRSNKGMMRRNAVAYLRNCGYNAGVCRTKWESCGGLTGGSYEFIDVVRADSPPTRYIVDLDFAAEFAIARPASCYDRLMRRLPGIFVGSGDELRLILKAASDAARWSMKSGGLILPPWRKHRFMQNKWLGPYRRSTSLIPSSSSSSAANRNHAVKCRSVGFDAAAAAAAANGGHLLFPAAARTR